MGSSRHDHTATGRTRATGRRHARGKGRARDHSCRPGPPRGHAARAPEPAGSTGTRTSSTGLVAGIGLGAIGWVLSHQFLQGSNWGTDMVVTVTMAGWVIGLHLGIGAFNAPVRWMLGHDQTHEDELYAAGVGQGAHALLEVLHRPQGRRRPVPDRWCSCSSGSAGRSP